MAEERDQRLIEAAMVLRGYTPDGWQTFVDELGVFAAAALADMLRCKPEELVMRQGVAHGLAALVAVLRDAPKTYDQRRSRNAGRPG